MGSRSKASRHLARDMARGLTLFQQSPEDLRAQDDFPFFCEWVTRNTGQPLIQPEHMQLWNELIITNKDTNDLRWIAGPNLDLLSPRGSAKAQPLDEPVLTPNGWVPMGQLAVGDLVMTANGTATAITRITPQGVKDSYKVTFTDGSFTYCSDDHLWSVRNLAGGNAKEFKTLNLNHLRTQVFVSSSGNYKVGIKTKYREALPNEKPWLDYRGYAKYHIPIVEPVQFPAQSNPVNPYLLGVLIGDGSLTQSSVSFSTGDLEQLKLLEPYIPPDCHIIPKGKNPSNYQIVRQQFLGSTLRNPLITGLRDLGLWGTRSESKFIPDCYLQDSVENRVALLQGLMDTDGTVGSSQSGGGNLSFCSVSRQLIDGVVALVQSLGGIATVNAPQRNWYTHKGERRQGQTSWKVGIKLPASINPFRLTRKLKCYKPCTKLTPTRGIVNIELVGAVEMQCITVAHASQLYITRDYIVTHNSTYLGLLLAWLIGKHTIASIHLPVLYISYNIEIARAKSSAIKRILESTEYQQIFPQVRPGRKWSDEYWAIDYDFAGINLVGREPFTVCCAGLKGGITSKRSALVIFDDIIKSAEDIDNPDIREELIVNWRNVIKPTMFQGARAICLGTRFRGDDIHATTFCEMGGWQQIEQQALLVDEDGNEYSYWEEMWSTEYLLDLRDGPDGDPIAFSFQYQNKVLRVSQVSIDPKWIIKSEPLWDLRQYDSIAVGLDLSSRTKERNDYTVAVLGGRIRNEFHILDIARGKWMGNLDKINAMMDLFADWGLVEQVDSDTGRYYLPSGIPVRIYGEDVQYQASLAGDWKTKVVQEWGIYELQYVLSSTHGMDLLTHLRGVTGLFQNEMVHFNMYRPLGPIITELVNYGSSSHDDCVSATTHLLRGLRKQSQIESF